MDLMAKDLQGESLPAAPQSSIMDKMQADLNAPDAAPANGAAPADSRGGLDQVRDFSKAFGHHVMNMPHGLAQLIENGVDYGAQKLPDNPLTRAIHSTVASDNTAMAQREKDYQASTPNSAGAYAGATVGEVAPFLANAVGNGIKAIGDIGAKTVSNIIPQETGKFIPQAAGSALQGAAISAAQPATDGGDFWDEKSKQAKYGALLGSITPTIINGAASVIQPKVSAAYQSLKDAGVDTTIGQRLGGIFNTIEDKSQSLPIVGDMISKARSRALQSWNTATLNDVVAPIGGKITQTGHDGVAQAGDMLSGAYKDVLGKIQGVSFDPTFNADFGQLQKMSAGLTPDMAARFNNIVADKFSSRLSPAGGMDATTLKGVMSDVNGLARKYAGSTGSEGELGDAIKQFGSLINQQVSRSNPEQAPMLDAIDAGWAKLVRVEGAAKAAASNKVNTGVFTPSQLMQAVRSNDSSVRDRATARGEALMQDWAHNGLKVLGDKVPNSGTFDRGINGAAMIGLATHPQYAIPAVLGIGGGSALYTKLGQKMANGLADLATTTRPAGAENLAAALRSYIPSVSR